MVEKKNSKFADYKIAIIFGVGGFFLALFLIFVVGSPLYKNFQKSRVELAEKQEAYAAAEEKLATLERLKPQETELTEQNEKVLAALPTDKDVSRLFIQLEKIAKENGITITNVSEGNIEITNTEPGTVNPVTYTVTAASNNYDAVKKALAKIETAIRVLSVDKIEMTANTATFTVKTFVRGEE